jgi:membrane protein
MRLTSRYTFSLRRLITRPTHELTRAQRSIRFAVDLSRHCAHELLRNRATQMAAALTYRTLFSLVPLAVLALLVFRAFVGLDSAQSQFQKTAFDFLGWSSLSLPAASTGAQDGSQATTGGGEAQAMAEERLNELVRRAWDLDFGSIGKVGLLLLIWAALALAVTVEQCFNHVYRCPTGRPWHHRIPIYWAIITLGPVLLFVSLYMATGAVTWVEQQEIHFITSIVQWASRFTALGASWLLLFLLYFLMPTATVRLRPALIGSFVAAIVWEAGKAGFQLYVTRAVMVSALYGSLGLIPVFLLWLYMTWLVVLFGLQISYTLQAMKGRKFAIAEAAASHRVLLGDPRWLVGMMALIGKSFTNGLPVSAAEISQQLLIPASSVVELGELLERHRLVHRVEPARKHDGGYSLAMPPDRIRLAALLELSHEQMNGGKSNAANQLLDHLHAAQRDAAGDRTLETLFVGSAKS